MSLTNIVNGIFPEEPKPSRVVFRVDAGRRWGLSFGHLFRCQVLAGYLQKHHETEAFFLMKNIKEGVECAYQLGLKVDIIPDQLDQEIENQHVIAHMKSRKPEVLIVDIPTTENIPYIDWAKDNNITTVYIDDQGNNNIHPDVLVNGRADFDKSDYKTTETSVRYLCGSDYFIMEDLPTWQRKTHKKNLVLITFGGSDPSGLTEKVIDTIESYAWKAVEFTIILGPGFPSPKAKKLLGAHYKNVIKLLLNPESLTALYYQHALCVCAGGRTLSELIKIGMPCLPVASIEHEAKMIANLIEKKIIQHGLLQWQPATFITTLRRTLGGIKTW